MKADDVLARLGLATTGATGTFPDGAHFRTEIPSVEGAAVLAAVIDAAREHGIVVNRVSQGSGAMLHSESELRAMAELGADAGLEASLFVGPREGFDIGAHARSPEGSAHAGQLRGLRGLAYAVEDVARAVEAGIRSFLVADAGLLSILREMQAAGELPAEIVWKISVLMAPSNPASFRVLEGLGAGTVNIPSDVTVEQLAEFRAASALPIDLYVESPDSLGGVVRGHEAGALIRAAAPLYAKYGLRNSRPLYPSGVHIEREAAAIAQEKVRRAAVSLEWIRRLEPDLVQSEPGAEGLGIPVVGVAAAAGAGRT